MSEVSDVVQDFLEMEEDVASLEHYGRMGMKWYQHIYGEEDGRAMYSKKNEGKYEKDKSKRLQKAETQLMKSDQKYSKKISRAESKGALDKAQLLRLRQKATRERLTNTINKINTMNFDDFCNEATDKRMRVAKNLILTGAGLTGMYNLANYWGRTSGAFAPTKVTNSWTTNVGGRVLEGQDEFYLNNGVDNIFDYIRKRL